MSQPILDPFIKQVVEKLEQYSSTSTPVDFAQTVYTPQPTSTLSTPEKTLVVPTEADKPKEPTVSTNIPVNPKPNTPSLPEKTVATSKPSTQSPRSSKSTTQIKPKTTTQSSKADPKTATGLVFGTDNQSTVLYPPTKTYPSAQSKIKSGESTPTAWTQDLQRRISGGERFGTSTSDYPPQTDYTSYSQL